MHACMYMHVHISNLNLFRGEIDRDGEGERERGREGRSPFLMVLRSSWQDNKNVNVSE